MNLEDIKDEKTTMYDIKFTNQVYSFQIPDKIWEQVNVNSEIKPQPRNFHSSVVIDGKMYVFGGKSNTYFNDLYTFDFEKETWNKLTPKGELPSKRYGQSCVCYKDDIYMFGGYDHDSSSCNDLWKYSTSENTWKLMEVKLKPSARFHHRCLVKGDDMILFGGVSEKMKSMNDLWIFSFDTKTWKFLDTSGEIPSEKYGFQMFEYKNKIFVFGGCNQEKGFDEIHSITLEKLKWNKISTHIFPLDIHGARVYSSHVIDKDCLYFYGGMVKEVLVDKKLESKPDLLKLLTEDAILNILSYLNTSDLCKIGLVSKKLFEYSSRNIYWKSSYQKYVSENHLEGILNIEAPYRSILIILKSKNENLKLNEEDKCLLQ